MDFIIEKGLAQFRSIPFYPRSSLGITIVQKSDLNQPKPDPKVALVLSGGGISGGAFKDRHPPGADSGLRT